MCFGFHRRAYLLHCFAIDFLLFSLTFIDFIDVHGFTTSVSPESSGKVWGGLGSSRVWEGQGRSGDLWTGPGRPRELWTGPVTSGEVSGGLGTSESP